MNIVLLGPPGVGKGTCAKFLKEKFGLSHLSTGEILRKTVAAGTVLGQQAKEYLDKGELVPDNLVVNIARGAIEQTGDGIILDGFPRNIKQAIFLDEMNFKIDHVLYFTASKDTLLKRVTSRLQKEDRDDDSEELFIKRLTTYETRTAPLISYYIRSGVLRRVTAEGTAEVMNSAVVDLFDNFTIAGVNTRGE